MADEGGLGPKGRRLVAVALGISLATIVVLFFYFRTTQQLSFQDAFQDIRIRYVLAALGLHVLAHLIWAARTAAVAAGMDHPLRFWPAFLITTAGVFGAAVTPARVGGDGLRLVLLRRQLDEDGASTRIVLGDRTLDLAFFLLGGFFATAAIPALFGTNAILVRGFVVPAMFVFAVILVLVGTLAVAPGVLQWVLDRCTAMVGRFWPRTGARLRAFLTRLGGQLRDGILCLVMERPGWLFVAFLLTVGTWVVEFSILWVLLTAFGHTVPLLHVLAAALLLNIATSIPLTPGGSGIAEIVALALFSQLAPGINFAFVLVWRTITYYYDVAVGGVVAFRTAARKGPVGAAG